MGCSLQHAQRLGGGGGKRLRAHGAGPPAGSRKRFSQEAARGSPRSHGHLADVSHWGAHDASREPGPSRVRCAALCLLRARRVVTAAPSTRSADVRACLTAKAEAARSCCRATPLCTMSPEPASQPPDPQGVSCSLEEPPAEHLDQGSAAFLAGDYEEAAELFRSLLAGLAQPERGLCLQLGDALSRAGRLPEAIGAFRGAALLGPLKPEELEELASGLARALGLREKRPPAVVRPGFAAGSPVPMAPRDLLGCPRCGRLLYKPVTLASGLTVCKRCVELVPGRAQARRVNVVLSGLVERCFPAECRLRKLACQARGLQRQQQPEAALLRCQQALDMGESASRGTTDGLGGGRWHF